MTSSKQTADNILIKYYRRHDGNSNELKQALHDSLLELIGEDEYGTTTDIIVNGVKAELRTKLNEFFK